MKPLEFDLKKEYGEELAPLAHELQEMCKAKGIPCMLAFCTTTDDAGERLRTTAYMNKERFSRAMMHALSVLEG